MKHTKANFAGNVFVLELVLLSGVRARLGSKPDNPPTTSKAIHSILPLLDKFTIRHIGHMCRGLDPNTHTHSL